MDFVSHDLDPNREFTEILYEQRPVFDNGGSMVEGLHTGWVPSLLHILRRRRAV